MGRAYHLKAVQKLPVSLETAWKYFSNPHNLLSITPPALKLQMTSKILGDEVYAGQVMTYKVKPIFGITFLWKTEIMKVEQMKMFADDQRKGPYRQWYHEHHFRSIQGGVEMTDLVDYRLPFGFLGDLTHGGIVKPRVLDVFQFRFQRINEIFGAWQGEVINLTIT